MKQYQNTLSYEDYKIHLKLYQNEKFVKFFYKFTFSAFL